MRNLGAIALILAAGPALAAGDYGTFSLKNTDFIVALGFLVFIGILLYFKVPGMLNGALDDRATQIKSELDEAKSLRDEAQALLASYERKQAEVQEQADRIVETAKADAEAAAVQAREDIQTSVARRLAAAEDQIKSAEEAAIREVREAAVSVAVGAATDVIAKQMDGGRQDALIDAAIEEASQKLH